MAEILSGVGLIPIIGAILLFVAVVLIVVGVGAMLQEFEFMQRRLAGPRSAIQEEAPSAPRSILIEDNLSSASITRHAENLEELSRTVSAWSAGYRVIQRSSSLERFSRQICRPAA
jgi:hypothetical protein